MKKKNVVLLTTKTSHHFFFINQISKISNLTVVFENDILKPNFETSHNYEKKQISYEKKNWFKNKNIQISKDIKFIKVDNINDNKTIEFIKLNNPEIIFSFGISRLKKVFINNVKKKICNFHGGDTAFYRGLDSHLWSLYHNDLRGLKVTLHEVDKNLDSGKIIFQRLLNLKNTKELCQLRTLNTELCIKLAKKLIKNSKTTKIKQNELGRYYSFMPKDLKNLVNIKYRDKLKIIYNDS